MATAKKRINISLSDRATEAVSMLAFRNQLPPATQAALLIETALELEEDQIWDNLAKKRDDKNVKFANHDQAWK